MTSDKAFFDTNVLLYLLSEDTVKADRAESVIVQGGIISAQVLNEFAFVARRKMAMSLPEVREVLAPLYRLCEVTSVTLDTHIQGIQIAERYQYNIWDAMIVASALMAHCVTLYTEDMYHGQILEGRLHIVNPFL
ncbi:PIN domain-containing protein [Acidithiobacillus ferrivorans]|nr:PIN domain-containing protein [Acidithiobacillus ferrivorans]